MVGLANGTFTGTTNFAAGRRPPRSRSATSTATRTPTSRSRTSSRRNVSILLGAAGGSFTGPTDFGAGDAPHLGRGGRLQRRLGPPTSRSRTGPLAVSRSCSTPPSSTARRHAPRRPPRRAFSFHRNGKLDASVTLRGATDPDGDSATLTIDGAHHEDEPGKRPGRREHLTRRNACIGGEPRSGLRAERSGHGDGRVYRIGFTAVQTARAAHARGRLPSRSRSPGHALPSTRRRPSFDSFSGTQL